jgi:HPt (histidine-containing phosphotransfer) domain-containing protein
MPDVNEPGSQNLVDWQHALKMVEQDEDLLLVVIEGCLEETPDLLNQLQTAIRNADAEQAKRVCHTLKGNAQSLGIKSLEKHAARMEELAASASLSAVSEEVPRLTELAGMMTRELNDRLSSGR